MNITELLPWPRGDRTGSDFGGEEERLAILDKYELEDLRDDAELTRIARFAASLCDAPMAHVTLIDSEHQHFIAGTGLSQRQGPRETNFSAYAMFADDLLVVPDAQAQHECRDFALVAGPPNVRFYAGAPLVSPEGAPLGAISIKDVEPRRDGLTELQSEGLQILARAVMQRLQAQRDDRRTRAELANRVLQFQTLVESLPEITWSASEKGEITYINERWTEYTSLPSDDFDSDRIRRAYHPDEIEPWRKDWLAALERGEPYEGEYRLKRQDGSYGWIMARAMPVRDREGVISGWVGQLIDIDAQRRMVETRELLAKELSHRIKNIFSVISSLVSLRSRNAPESQDFADQLIDSIAALGRAHTFIRTGSSENEEDLLGLLEVLFAPYGEHGEPRIVLTGDTVPIGAKAATPLALIFHELATNAAKYGALSQAEGSVAVELERQETGIAIHWREIGGAAPTEPDSIGFGTKLIDMSITSQLRGTIERAWKDGGLDVKIALPLAALAN